MTDTTDALLERVTHEDAAIIGGLRVWSSRTYVLDHLYDVLAMRTSAGHVDSQTRNFWTLQTAKCSNWRARQTLLETDPYGPDSRFAKVVRLAMSQFWASVASQMYEADSGDFPPDAELEFAAHCEAAVKTWLHYNHPHYTEDS